MTSPPAAEEAVVAQAAPTVAAPAAEEADVAQAAPTVAAPATAGGRARKRPAAQLGDAASETGARRQCCWGSPPPTDHGAAEDLVLPEAEELLSQQCDLNKVVKGTFGTQPCAAKDGYTFNEAQILWRLVYKQERCARHYVVDLLQAPDRYLIMQLGIDAEFVVRD